jgi:hypothetical protein
MLKHMASAQAISSCQYGRSRQKLLQQAREADLVKPLSTDPPKSRGQRIWSAPKFLGFGTA